MPLAEGVDHRLGGRARRARAGAGAGAAVPRLRQPGVPPDRGPGRANALPLAGPLPDADGDPRAVRRQRAHARAALRRARGEVRAGARAQDRDAGDRVRRQGPAGGGDPRSRPGALLRAAARLPAGQGRGPGRATTPCRSARRAWRARATDVTWSPGAPPCMSPRRRPSSPRREGISCGVLDLRTLVPLDVEALREAVARTGGRVVVHEAPLHRRLRRGGGRHDPGGGVLVARGAVRRVTAPDTPYPIASIEEHYVPMCRAGARRASAPWWGRGRRCWSSGCPTWARAPPPPSCSSGTSRWATRWHEDTPLAEVQTDKAIVVLPSPHGGCGGRAVRPAGRLDSRRGRPRPLLGGGEAASRRAGAHAGLTRGAAAGARARHRSRPQSTGAARAGGSGARIWRSGRCRRRHRLPPP